MDFVNTCDTDLENSKYISSSPDHISNKSKSCLDNLKKSFRKRKKIVEKITSRTFEKIKQEIEENS